MNLQERKAVLVALGSYLKAGDELLETARRRAATENPWFITEFTHLAIANIAGRFLAADKLQEMIDKYDIGDPAEPRKVGIVMAGNIPLVGFHDLMCTFLTGHTAVIKPSAKDSVLINFVIKKMVEMDGQAASRLVVAERLKGCDAYIATGGDNTAGYFDYYFGKYPHIIRRNRTSVALLTGRESDAELEALADDVYLYFGLGCRNVTKLLVPRDFNFERLLNAFRKYDYLADYQKYKNNYDYHLAILLLNHQPYMSNSSILLAEEKSPFSPIAQLNYEFYDDAEAAAKNLTDNNSIQCVVGGNVGFGQSQLPGICDYADGIDTIAFLQGLTDVRRS